MLVIWCDVETTGISPQNSGAFEIAMLFAHNGTVKSQKVFYLNPLSDTILYHENSGKIHGVSEAEILSYRSYKEVVPEIATFLQGIIDDYGDGKSLWFAGYNCKFDYCHMWHLFSRCSLNFDEYFCNQFDVMDYAKQAVYKKCVKRFSDLKLETVCKALHVPLDVPHMALADITATRGACMALYRKGAPLPKE